MFLSFIFFIIFIFNNIYGNSVERIGVQNNIFASGTGQSKGTYTFLAGSSSGNMFGHDVFFDYLDCGTGNKYGYHVIIPSITCGIHYGVFSVVEKSNSYAGYFLGRTAIGTDAANTYILPLSRGTAGQIMQTDGSGNVTWQSASTALGSNFWGTSGNSGTNATTNFIGTTDNQDLVFKRNNINSGAIRLTNSTYGVESGINITTAGRNTAIGSNSLHSNVSASYSTALGANAFYSGNFSNSVAIGDASVISANNQIRMGDAGVTSIGGFANWTNVSDKRFKKNVQENVPGLSFITKLKPVTYSLDLDAIHGYLKTPDNIRKPETETEKKQEIQTGFIAQDVEKAANELGFEFSGVDKPKNNQDYYGLRYAEFVVPLVKAVQEQQQIIEQQQVKINSLEERLAKIEALLNKQ
mgnify:FL=1